MYRFFAGLGLFGVFACVFVPLALLPLTIIGWVLNIIALVHSLGGEIGWMVLIRALGVIAAPLGAVLGWFA